MGAQGMNRRSFLKSAVTLVTFAAAPGCDARAGSSGSTRDMPQLSDWAAGVLAEFPFEWTAVPGADALQEWERLKREGRGESVVIGSERNFEDILTPFSPDYYMPSGHPSALADILAKADRLKHPEDLLTYQRDQEEEAARASKELCEKNPKMRCDTAGSTPHGPLRDRPRDYEPPVGEWPKELPPPMNGLTVAEDSRQQAPLETVIIVLVPTDDATTIPAHLRWGGWNANPPAEFHVAALRSWRDRFGAELIGLGPDVINLRVARRPKTREEAMALAREQYLYCNDIVDQGVGTLSRLAALLYTQDWWYFWWD